MEIKGTGRHHRHRLGHDQRPSGPLDLAELHQRHIGHQGADPEGDHQAGNLRKAAAIAFADDERDQDEEGAADHQNAQRDHDQRHRHQHRRGEDRLHAIGEIGHRVGGRGVPLGAQARQEGGGNATNAQPGRLHQKERARARIGREIAHCHAGDLGAELYRRGHHHGALQLNPAMTGAGRDADHRIDGAVTGRHDKAAGDPDQKGKTDHHPIGQVTGQQHQAQRARRQAGENVEIEDDAAPVLAFGEDAGEGQEQHHRRRQRGLRQSEPLRAFLQGKGDDAGEQGGLQAEAEKPARHQHQIGAEGRHAKLAIAGKGAKDGQGVIGARADCGARRSCDPA